jgi:preprotein translocase subunit SecG
MALLYYTILTVHILVCFFLIGVVLIQQGKGQDLASAFGGGGTQTAFGPRGSANVLSRATTVLAGVFMVTSLTLSVLRPTQSSVLDRVQTPAPVASPAASPAALPSAPPAGNGSTPAAPVSAAPSPAPKGQ